MSILIYCDYYEGIGLDQQKHITMSSSIKQEKLLITNKKKLINQQSYQQQGQSVPLPAIQRELQQSHVQKGDLNERMKRLQGNLKLLQKKYRQNLKEGFQNKIKAYRLQAVFERRVLKEAMRQMQKEKGESEVKKKWSVSEKKNELYNSRIEIMKMERYQRSHQLRESKKKERASFSICLHENREVMKTMAKQSHDKIIEQQENINKKKDYFDYLRKSSYKRQQQTEKQQLLQRIINNSQKLKEAKQTLQLLKYNQETQDRSKTFLTI